MGSAPRPYIVRLRGGHNVESRDKRRDTDRSAARALSSPAQSHREALPNERVHKKCTIVLASYSCTRVRARLSVARSLSSSCSPSRHGHGPLAHKKHYAARHMARSPRARRGWCAGRVHPSRYDGRVKPNARSPGTGVCGAANVRQDLQQETTGRECGQILSQTCSWVGPGVVSQLYVG